MARVISTLTADDLPELSKFLTIGFGVPPDADFAGLDVLQWKYLSPAERSQCDEPGRGSSSRFDSGIMYSFVARDDTGRIVGHLGICQTMFEGHALMAQGGQVSTMHIVDWLGSPDHRSVGISLMRRAHDATLTQFGLGVSQAALVLGERAGYELRSLVPVYTRVLRASYWLRTTGLAPIHRWMRLARDAAWGWAHPLAEPSTHVTLKRVTSFGSEIRPIIESAWTYVVLTRRDPERLNQMLRFPRQSMTGWHIVDQTGHLCGVALLNIIPKDGGHTRTGKIVDCLLENVDIALWQAAFAVLARELKSQGADVVQAYASTPWAAQALHQCRFRSQFGVKFHIRDRQGVIPRDVIFHLTPLEGDYAYT